MEHQKKVVLFLIMLTLLLLTTYCNPSIKASAKHINVDVYPSCTHA